MRDLTKAMTSYTWAMSVFWTQQMINMMGLGGSGSWDRSRRSFNNVTEATAEEMSDTMRAMFRGADTLQRGMVDLFLAPLSMVNGCGGSRDNGRRGDQATDGGWRDSARGTGWSADRGRSAYSDDGRRDGADRTRPRWSDREFGTGWTDTAARAAAAGVDALQSAIGRTGSSAGHAADQVSTPPPSAPSASDPSLGWGPMPR
jgi:hypothetical protein